MPRFEYKVVPAPAKGLKGKGIKGAEARFSHALQELMNGMAADGWEYQRAETLPSLERVGLTGSTTEWRNVLVFRRMRENEAELFAPELLPAPDETPPETAATFSSKARAVPNSHAEATESQRSVPCCGNTSSARRCTHSASRPPAPWQRHLLEKP